MSETPETLLHDDLLERIRTRASGYDRDNAFFDDDLAELADAGYLRALVPEEFGGLGWSLADAVRAQSRLAGAAPATALAVNMHLVWTGVAKVLRDRGDDSLEFVMREAGDGEVFGFGISEAGNDLMLFGSRSTAEPQADGGYRYTGRKIFTSLSPAWTRLGTMGLDTESSDAPKLVYGFIDREDPDVRTLDDWDTMGMRASQSRTTVLDGAYAASDRIVRRLEPGPNADPFIFAIFANFELLLSSVYAGIGARALDLAVAAARRRTSMKNDGRPLSQDPDIRWRVADAAIAQDALAAAARLARARRRRAGRPRTVLVPEAQRHEGARHRDREAGRRPGRAGGRRLDLLRRIRARAPVSRRARRHLPPLRRRVGALHGRERVARADRRLNPHRRHRAAVRATARMAWAAIVASAHWRSL